MLRTPLLLAAALLPGLAACSSTDELPEGRPLTPEEIAYEKALESYSEVATDDASRSRLIRDLDRTLQNWHQAQAEYLGSRERDLATNYVEILQRKTYVNFDVLVQVLRQGEPHQRPIAAAALGFSRLREPQDEREREAFRARWPPIYEAAIPALLEAIRSDDYFLVNNAVMALALLGDPGTPIAPIVALLDREDLPLPPPGQESDLRSNAAFALSRILTPATGERAITVLLNSMNDGDPKVRNHAVSAIRRTRHKAGVGAVAKLLSDRYELIAMNAAATLAEIGDVESCGYLISRLKTLHGETPDGKFRPVTDLDIRRRNLSESLIAALERLSGEDYDDDIEDWEDWWRERQGA